MSVCHSCKELKELVYTDPLERQYCARCATELPVPSVVRAMGFLSATIPFRPGDRVEYRTGGQLYEGVGVIDNISFDLENGGTPIYPAFHVVLDEKAYEGAPDDEWATEACLRRVDR